MTFVEWVRAGWAIEVARMALGLAIALPLLALLFVVCGVAVWWEDRQMKRRSRERRRGQ